jgi:predicted ribosome quality control (RQC) complex YloA/Tae2 family protein
LTILSGRNNLQNDQLTLKIAQKGDLWLHAQKIPGTHVIIQANRQPVPERTLLEAAAIAAWFSRASAAMPQDPSGLKVPVDYCPVSHVRKPPGARPGMVIYEHYQTVLVIPQDPKARAESSL